MNSDDTPPGGNRRDLARPQAAPATSSPGPARVDVPPPNVAGTGLPLSVTSTSPDRDATPAVRHRVAAGLPPQPPPFSVAAPANAAPQTNPVAPGAASRPHAAESPTPDRPPAKAAAVSAAPGPSMPASGMLQPASPARVVLGASEPEPPISGRPDGLGASLMEPKRITPRSPRAALEPDHVPGPARPSRRARNPLVHRGQCCFDRGGPRPSPRGRGSRFRQEPIRGAGPLARGQDRQHSPALRHRGDCRPARSRRGDGCAPPGLHRRGVRAQGALGAQGRRISLPQAVRASKTSWKRSSKARWCSTSSPFPRA